MSFDKTKWSDRNEVKWLFASKCLVTGQIKVNSGRSNKKRFNKVHSHITMFILLFFFQKAVRIHGRNRGFTKPTKYC